MTSRSRLVIRTESELIAVPARTACAAIWEKSDSVNGDGRTFVPSATDLIVPRKSSNVASLSRKPETPASMKSTISSCAGIRSITMTLISAYAFLITSTTRRLF
jgi:hypothetical protein